MTVWAFGLNMARRRGAQTQPDFSSGKSLFGETPLISSGLRRSRNVRIGRGFGLRYEQGILGAGVSQTVCRNGQRGGQAVKALGRGVA